MLDDDKPLALAFSFLLSLQPVTINPQKIAPIKALNETLLVVFINSFLIHNVAFMSMQEYTIKYPINKKPIRFATDGLSSNSINENYFANFTATVLPA